MARGLRTSTGFCVSRCLRSAHTATSSPQPHSQQAQEAAHAAAPRSCAAAHAAPRPEPTGTWGKILSRRQGAAGPRLPFREASSSPPRRGEAGDGNGTRRFHGGLGQPARPRGGGASRYPAPHAARPPLCRGAPWCVASMQPRRARAYHRPLAGHVGWSRATASRLSNQGLHWAVPDPFVCGPFHATWANLASSVRTGGVHLAQHCESQKAPDRNSSQTHLRSSEQN